MTTKARALASRIEVRPPEGGVAKTSYVIGEQTRTVSSRRLVKRLGQVSRPTLARASDVVRMLLGL